MSRNEPARARRRLELREKLSLRSIPLAEYPEQKYNLENHFGWQVLQKCRIGEGSFPSYLLPCAYCDKPDMSGKDDGDHEVYVLYVRGEDGKLEPVDVKETQTVFSTTNIVERETSPEQTKAAPKNVKRVPLPQHRKRVISDFYYIPIRERTVAKYDIRPPSVVKSNSAEDVGDVGDKKKDKKKKKKADKGRAMPKSWQLRAGAESPEEESEEEVCEDERISKFIENLKKECANCFHRPNTSELMDSPDNKYLYLPRERYEKRQNLNLDND
ncbi:uncharacterized protein LOC128987519 [Macrosteles quadrilineatus]|uniref:uncharacterized protein LOC128987519 n=1 Tax=Macrosteles quadrilineatus TaxID=74068 RepID=UPI0023E29EA1|nr:uncharacterized protein LOC128987519 [Macrosteles quadrilineatus]